MGGRGVEVGVGGGGDDVEVADGSAVGLGGAVSRIVVAEGLQALEITSRMSKIAETMGRFLICIFKAGSPGGSTRAIITEVDLDGF